MAGAVRARVVHGAKTLAEAGKPLFFWTFTCRGRDLDLSTADDDYYAWTNKALTNLRQQAKRQGQPWAYVQVTERQQRGAAHSHFVHTFTPDDSEVYQDEKGRFTLISAAFISAVVASGLGPQCQITVIETPEAVAHYISGYLEKHVNSDVWPRHWRRVRWSRDWPDLPDQQADFRAVLRDRHSFEQADKSGYQFQADNDLIYEYARRRMIHVQRPGTALVDTSTKQAYGVNAVS